MPLFSEHGAGPVPHDVAGSSQDEVKVGEVLLQAGGLIRKGTFPMCSSWPLVPLAPLNPAHALDVLSSLVTPEIKTKQGPRLSNWATERVGLLQRRGGRFCKNPGGWDGENTRIKGSMSKRSSKPAPTQSSACAAQPLAGCLGTYQMTKDLPELGYVDYQRRSWH